MGHDDCYRSNPLGSTHNRSGCEMTPWVSFAKESAECET